MQGRDGKVVQVYRKRWVIHIERLTREKVNGAQSHSLSNTLTTLRSLGAIPWLTSCCCNTVWSAAALSASLRSQCRRPRIST